MELPGAFPTRLLVAMAIRAWAICASLSMSNFAAGTSSFSVKLLIRLFHVSKRWRNGMFESFGIASRKTTPMIPTNPSEPIRNNNLRAATRPMNIIRNTTPNSNMAVERFSGAINRHTIPVRIIIYLNAFGLAPSSSCFLERMKETAIITAILASSEGWNCNPMNDIQRAAPFTRSPVMTPISVTKASSTTETG